MVCESGLAESPNAVVASWIGDDGATFYLRKDSVSRPAQDAAETHKLSQSDRVHHAGTNAAAWAFGGVHIKVKSWIPTLQSEHETIEYVKNSSIPVPEVIFSWIDDVWDRSFLILRSIPGRTLSQAWPELSKSQKQHIAGRIASYCAQLALSCSTRMETLSGKGVREDYLTKRPESSVPSWMPTVAGPFTLGQLRSYLQSPSMDISTEFYFYHADLGPTNIILDGEHGVMAVIDWESAAYYPRFWIATKPLVSAGFLVDDGERGEWASLLSTALGEKGFETDVELYRKWRAALRE